MGSTSGAEQPTPYMERRRFKPNGDAADPDHPVLSDDDIERAKKAGEQRS